MKAQDIIANTQDLPSLSEAALKLVSLLNRPDAPASDVVETVQYDPALSAKLLRVCNSAFLGSREPVASVNQAVFLLGYQQVYRLVMALCFGGLLNRPLPAFGIDDRGLWRHSLMTALAAEAAAGVTPEAPCEPSVAYTAGLLHDIGKLALSQALRPAELDAIRELAKWGNLPHQEVERTVLGTDHAEVGACLLQMWSLPEIIVEAVAHHHAPVVRPGLQLSALVHVANLAAHKLGPAPERAACGLGADGAAFAALGVGWDQFESLLTSAHASLERIEQFTASA